MVAGQHKLSRRALLAGDCALPLARHCEDPGLDPGDAAIQCDAFTAPAAGLLRSARNDGKGSNDGKWQEALARFNEADREIEALVHCPNQRVYDRALGRHSTALRRLLRAPAPDLAAAGSKLELIVRHHVFEASFGQAALASLRRDLARFAALPASQLRDLRGFACDRLFGVQACMDVGFSHAKPRRREGLGTVRSDCPKRLCPSKAGEGTMTEGAGDGE